MSEKSKAVLKMIEFIEKNLNSRITLLMLAKISTYSPFYCSKIFKEVTGATPFEYIKGRRLSEAARVIKESDTKIIDVAFDFVFDSHEGFTRAFSKKFGMAPRDYRKNGKKLKMILPIELKDFYILKQKGDVIMSNEKTNTIFVQVVDRPKRKLILKRGIKATHYFEYCEEVGCDVWEVLTSIKEAIYEPVGMWLPENMITQDTSKYAQGVEVPFDYIGLVPEGYEIIELPECKMMIFQSETYDDEDFETAIDLVWEKMKKYDPKIYGFRWSDEDGPRIQLEPLGYRGYIEARPVRQIYIN